MVATAIALLPIAFTRLVISRGEGLVLLGHNLAFPVLTATVHAALPAFSAITKLFVIPLTVCTLVTLAFHERRRRRGGAANGQGRR